MSKKLVLLDGHSLANRAFYALPRLTAASGQVTNAVYGFLTMLLRLIEEEKPAMVAAAFDRPTPTFRHVEFDQYKATRTGSPDDFKSQIPIIKAALNSLKIPIFEVDGYEADDVLGTIARKAEGEGIDTLLVTGDRDALQLVSDHVTVLLTRKGISEVARYDPDGVREALGITPSQVVDYKALVGDVSDNIPGVRGIGEKTALKMIREYGSVETLLQNLGDLKDSRARAALESGVESAGLSKRLATIVTDAPVDVRFEECCLKAPDMDGVESLFQELDFKNLARRVRDSFSRAGYRPEGDICAAGGAAAGPGAAGGSPTTSGNAAQRTTGEESILIQAAREFTTVTTAGELQSAVAKITGGDVIGMTFVVGDGGPGGGPATSPLVALLVTAPAVSFYARLARGGTLDGVIDGAVDAGEAIAVMARALEDPGIRKVAHAVKPALVALKQAGVNVRGLEFDTAIAAYLLDPTRSSYKVPDLSREHLGINIPGPEKGKPPSPEHLAACTAATVSLASKMGGLLEQNDLARLFREIEMPLVGVLADMEVAGVGVDPGMVERMSKEFSSKIDGVLTEIYAIAGCEFNVNSTKQLGEVLFERLNLPRARKTKTGYSTDAEVLEELARRHEIAAKVLEYRQLQKLKGTYLDGILDLIDRKTCRVHTTFQQTVTATGRLSSAEPNLQNIPIRMELGRMIRRIFVPKEGHVLLAGDYSQIELRILAHISSDPTMIDSFLRDEDIHRRTASEVFGVPIDQVMPEMRSRAKAVNFGIVYGISDFGLSQNLGISRAEAKAYIDSYFARYPGVKSYMENVVAAARDKGYVTTMFSRRRYLPDISSPNRNLRMFAERTAINTPIQGTAADIIKLAMVNIASTMKRRGLASRMILQVHDELVFEVPGSELDAMTDLVKKSMEDVVRLSVPLKVDLKSGPNWYDMKAI
ncbi:MAG: DNA polymerase I [Firmicutes bacterium]|nr:DNA polymerase I [Bacillota bacterium]